MFYLLCFCLVFAVMFIVYGATMLASFPLLQALARIKGRVRPGAAANLLFSLRTLPLVLAAITSLGLALPAFLKFEPSATREMPGLMLWLLAGLGLAILLTMAWRCWRIMRLTLSLERSWLSKARRLKTSFRDIPVFSVDDSASMVAVAGIFVPRVFVSRNVIDALTAAEFEAALSHELAHVSAWDNLRQLVLKVTRVGPLRFVAKMDALWASNSELAADERAIALGASPLNLSSALVKVGRLSFTPRPQLLAASHLVDGCSSATSARAKHLQELLQHGSPLKHTVPAANRGRLWLLCGATLLIYWFAVVTILPQVHEALEFIVR